MLLSAHLTILYLPPSEGEVLGEDEAVHGELRGGQHGGQHLEAHGGGAWLGTVTVDLR